VARKLRTFAAPFLTALLCVFLLAGCGVLDLPFSLPWAPALENEPAEMTEDTGLTVVFLDVGQADCIFLRCGGETMLIDGGNVDDSSLLVSFLTRQGVEKLDYVICTHAHEDHCGGLPAALANFPVGAVYAPVTERDVKFFKDFAKYTELQGLEIAVPAPGDSFSLGTAAVTVLGPVADYGEDLNNGSLVLHVDYGETSFLFTGDMEYEAEQDLLSSGADLRADVLKLGHHGSDSSTSYTFLREVAPAYAVASVGADNPYGHPSEAVLSRLRDAEVTLYRTDLQGTVTCHSDGETLTFETETYAAVTNPTAGSHETAEGAIIGNKNSLVYHSADCPSLPAEKNRVYFESAADAEAAGYRPHAACVKENG